MIAAARWRKASTREQCIALYPGSNPGRVSTLRPDGLRVAQPRRTGRAKRVRRSLSQAKAQTDWNLLRQLAERKRGKCRLIGPLRPFRGCGIWSKDHPRARATWRRA